MREIILKAERGHSYIIREDGAVLVSYLNGKIKPLARIFDKFGNSKINLSLKKGTNKSYYIKDLVYESFVMPIPLGQKVFIKNRNFQDLDLSNLCLYRDVELPNNYKYIEGYDGRYGISKEADIISLDSHGWRSLKKSIDIGGYEFVTLYDRNGIRSTHKVHRLLFEAYVSQIPKDNFIDHINRDRSDNSLLNLRLATRSQNAINTSPKSHNSIGVRKMTDTFRRKPYIASLRINTKKVTIGCYSTKIEAALAYNMRAVARDKEFAILNDIYSSDVFNSYINTKELDNCGFNILKLAS